MKISKYTLTTLFGVLFLIVGFLGGKYFNMTSGSGDVIVKEVLPDNFINIDSLDSLKIGDKILDYRLSSISEEKRTLEGDVYRTFTFVTDPDRSGPMDLSGSVRKGEAMDNYIFILHQSIFTLPVIYHTYAPVKSKNGYTNGNGYAFIDSRDISMDYDSGKALYEYWSKNGETQGQTYLESFDISTTEGISNLKVNPVGI